MAKRFWLFKSEPETFSIDHLAKAPRKTTAWEGVRNYQARNLLRDQVKLGDEVLFYHSSSEPKGIAGICTVVREAYPDPSARDPRSAHFEQRSTDSNPIWLVVDVHLKRRLPRILTLAELKETPGLQKMMVCQRGSRLSIQPVRPAEWEIIMQLIKDMK